MQEDVKALFHLLEKKNRCLLKFHKLNNDEIERLTAGCQDNLDNFYHDREALLSAIDQVDKRIAEEEKPARFEAQTAEKKRLKKILRLKRDMVLSILDQDLVILSLMSGLQEDNENELQPKASHKALARKAVVPLSRPAAKENRPPAAIEKAAA